MFSCRPNEFMLAWVNYFLAFFPIVNTLSLYLSLFRCNLLAFFCVFSWWLWCDFWLHICRFHAFLLFLGHPIYAVREVSIHRFSKILSEFALEYRTTRERVLQQKQKRANHRERNKTRGKMITDVSGLHHKQGSHVHFLHFLILVFVWFVLSQFYETIWTIPRCWLYP